MTGRMDQREDVQRHYAGLRKDYDRTGAKSPDCCEIVGRVAFAETRADTLLRYREDEDDRYGRPSTTAGHLTRAMREAAAAARGDRPR